MNASILKEKISSFKSKLLSQDNYEHLYLYEVQKNFQEHWGLMKEPMEDMISQSLHSDISRRLWTDKNFEPKEMMMAFAKLNKDYVRQMFLDLFDENKAIDGRMDRFGFYCDEMLKSYKRKHAHKVDNNHFHDHHMISLYLSLAYPGTYALYDHERFVKLLTEVKAKNPPRAADAPRYFKVIKIIMTFMDKEKGLREAHLNRLDARIHWTEVSAMLAYEMLLSTFPKR